MFGAWCLMFGPDVRTSTSSSWPVMEPQVRRTPGPRSIMIDAGIAPLLEHRSCSFVDLPVRRHTSSAGVGCGLPFPCLPFLVLPGSPCPSLALPGPPLPSVSVLHLRPHLPHMAGSCLIPVSRDAKLLSRSIVSQLFCVVQRQV